MPQRRARQRSLCGFTRIEIEQRLDLLAQHLHPLELAQYAQRDEVWHVQNAGYAEALAYPR